MAEETVTRPTRRQPNAAELKRLQLRITNALAKMETINVSQVLVTSADPNLTVAVTFELAEGASNEAMARAGIRRRIMLACRPYLIRGY